MAAGLRPETGPERVSDVMGRVPAPSLLDMAREAEALPAGELRRRIAESHAASVEHGRITADPQAPRLRIPARFRDASFDTFVPETDSQRTALTLAKRWVERTLAGKATMLALIGTTGAGKSHLLYAAARALAEADHRFYTRPWYKLADELRYGGRSAYFVPQQDNAGPLLEPVQIRTQLWEANVAFLDEVRPTASTAFDDTELAKYACHAYDAMLSVFVTSNVNPLADVMGPAAASRFTQVEIVGPDRRQAR